MGHIFMQVSEHFFLQPEFQPTPRVATPHGENLGSLQVGEGAEIQVNFFQVKNYFQDQTKAEKKCFVFNSCNQKLLITSYQLFPIQIYHKVASGYTVPRYHAFLYILSYRTRSPHWPPFLPFFRTFCTKGFLLCDQYEILYNLLLLLLLLLYIVFKKIITNTALHGTQFDIALGNHTLRAQSTVQSVVFQQIIITN